MAIEKTTDLGTGDFANYWKLTGVTHIKPVEGGGFSGSLTFNLYKNADAYANGLQTYRPMSVGHVLVSSSDPRHSDWESAGEVALLKASEPAVDAVPGVAAVEPVPARDGKPEVVAVEATPAVARKLAIDGGFLEGGRKV